MSGCVLNHHWTLWSLCECVTSALQIVHRVNIGLSAHEIYDEISAGVETFTFSSGSVYVGGNVASQRKIITRTRAVLACALFVVALFVAKTRNWSRIGCHCSQWYFQICKCLEQSALMLRATPVNLNETLFGSYLIGTHVFVRLFIVLGRRIYS